MIVDIVFYDFDSDNLYVYVMLILKIIGFEGFGKKERSWNDRKMFVLWCELWVFMVNSYFVVVGLLECIDYCFFQVQYEEVLEKVVVVLDNEEKVLWFVKVVEINCFVMKCIYSVKWCSKVVQE